MARVVAELGRPETPAETAARKAESSRRYRSSKTFRNLIAALLATVGIVLVVVVGVPRGTLAERPQPDVVALSADLAADIGRPALAPALPEGWRVNQATVEGQGGTQAWTMVYVRSGESGFLRVAQGLDTDESWAVQVLDGARSTETVDIDGITWNVYRPGDPTRSGNISYAIGTDASDASDTGEVLPAARLDSDFAFAEEQQNADARFAACGGSARHPLADQVYLLEEKERPGQLMPIMEDEHGTYIMNSKDLRAVEHVQRLVQIGVDSLKIEGRTKSQYYVARTAQVYRRAIDDAMAGRAFDPALLTELESLSNRGYTSGFLERRPAQDTQNYATGSSTSQRSQYVGQVLSAEGGWAEVETKNRFAVGDTLEVVHPTGNRQVRVERMRSLDGAPLEVAAGSPLRVRIPLDGPADGAMLARLF